jgi:hypothetical protein
MVESNPLSNSIPSLVQQIEALSESNKFYAPAAEEVQKEVQAQYQQKITNVTDVNAFYVFTTPPGRHLGPAVFPC